MSSFTFTKLTTAGLAACLAAGVVHQSYAELASRTRRYAGFERHRLRCGSGNIITYHVRRGAPGGPTLVCEAGLMNTSAAWLLLADHLDPALSLVLYDRAGYRSSLRRCPEDYSLSESANDLVEVITEAVAPGGPCVLVGHSLGGYLVHRAAAAAPDRVHGLVLIDPTHPRELIHSRRQREGSRAANLTMKLGPWSAVLGGGLLLDKKGMFSFAEGSPHYRTLRLEASAPSTWRATRREWDYSYAFMLDGGRPLDRLRIPVSVVAAESTMRDIPEHEDLYEDYVASGSGGRVTTIEGSSHVSVTGGIAYTPVTVKVIEEAVAEIAARFTVNDRQEQGDAA